VAEDETALVKDIRRCEGETTGLRHYTLDSVYRVCASASSALEFDATITQHGMEMTFLSRVVVAESPGLVGCLVWYCWEQSYGLLLNGGY